MLNRAQYTQLDKILLGKVHTCRSMYYIVGVWKSWMVLMRYLFLSPTTIAIPAHWRVEDILHALHPLALMEVHTIKNIALTLGKLGITKAGHLWELVDNSWKSFEAKLARTRSILAKLRVLIV